MTEVREGEIWARRRRVERVKLGLVVSFFEFGVT